MKWAKRIGLGTLGLLLVLLVAWVTFAPPAFDRMANPVRRDAPFPQSADAKAFAKQHPIIDLHGDPLLWRRDLVEGVNYGHIDLQRLERGGMALQVFSSVTKTPRGQNYESNSGETDNITLLAMSQLQPVRTWTSLLERSLFHADKLERFERESEGRLRIVRSVAQINQLMAERAAGKRVVGAMLSVEGLQNLEGKLSNVDVLHAKGFRMFGLAHFFDNEVAGSVHGEAKYGLTPLGRQVIARMETKGIIVDLAHASHQTIADVLAIATKPVLVSHGGVKAVCDNNRNLSDDEVRGIARTGGIIGIGFWDAAVCDPVPAGIVKAMTHVRDLVGIDYVALGSDFDGAVAVPFDAGEMAMLTQALMDAGWNDADIAKVMGGNALRVFAATLPPQ
jgi:membrane dipeptidase